MASPRKSVLPTSVPPELNLLISLLSKLAGISEAGALRHIFSLIPRPELASSLGQALVDLPKIVAPCPVCNYLAKAGENCLICRSNKKTPYLLCLVHKYADVIALEASGQMKGYYFVLGKLCSPLEGVDEKDLPFKQLARRALALTLELRGAGVVDPNPLELLIALPTSVEGNATAMMVERYLGATMEAEDRPRLTQLPTGMPSGAELTFADALTLGSALENRIEFGTKRTS